MSVQLAIHGASPLQTSPLKPYISIGKEEKEAVLKVMESGILSGFVACADERFYGGPWVKAFEREFKQLLNIPYAVSFNSATSALVAAVGALDLGLGDEIIVPAQTMSASATAALAYNAVPVFADVEDRTFCLDPESVRSKISENTRGLMIVHLYGHPARMDELMKIADQFNLKVIEDCAQSPLGKYKNKHTGTMGDIGVFSYNVHKHVNSGEGGIAITKNPDLMERMALIRNHGEIKSTSSNLSNIVGWNFRLTELQAAVALEQTKKLKDLVNIRRKLAEYFTGLLEKFDWITPPVIEKGCEHSYYDFPMKINFTKLGLSGQEFMDITESENLPITESYKPVYWQDIYQKKIVYGKEGFPFTQSLSKKNRDNYAIGSCPVAESMYKDVCLTFEICSYELDEDVIDKIIKMFSNIEEFAKNR